MSNAAILPPTLSRASFSVALIAIFIMAMIPLPEVFNAFSWQDKLEHCAAFLVLMLLGWSGWPDHTRRIATGLLMYGVLIELSQHFFTLNRVGDPWDVMADASGLLIGSWLIHLHGARGTSTA
ncbi:VanZ family protein [Zoogloea sp.]|uniref:VanZ family protein n=1 Tax=Zoogloea sp. TaxID=49181 RepID=UPI0035B4A89B